MNKRGFTLVEILGSIVILSIIALIAVPLVSKMLKESKSNLSDVQVKAIQSAAKGYATDRVFGECSSSCTTTVSDLIKKGYLDENDSFKDDYGDKNVKITFNSGKYKIEVEE